MKKFSASVLFILVTLVLIIETLCIVVPSDLNPTYVQPSYVNPTYTQSNYIAPSYIQPSYIEPASYIEKTLDQKISEVFHPNRQTTTTQNNVIYLNTGNDIEDLVDSYATLPNLGRLDQIVPYSAINSIIRCPDGQQFIDGECRLTISFNK